jgi:hypothetical protein
VVLEATPTRQILNLGPLRKGDRLYLSLLSTPGYGEFLQTNERFSVMVLDGQQEVFAWYQESYVLFTPDAKLIIGHDSPNYYVVVDGVPPTLFSSPVYGQSVAVRVEPDVGLVPRQQRIYLDFAGGKTVAIPDYVPFAPPPFHAEDLNSNWGAAETATIKAGIVQYMRDRYARFNVVISTSDDGHEPVKPFQTVYFGGRSDEFYGISQYIDPRNETLTGAALVTTLDIAFDFPQVTPEEMGDLIGSVATHESAHLLGLRHTEGGFNDIMDPNAPIGSPTAIFVSSPLYRAEEYNGQIGTQNAPILLEEVVGLKPQP